MTASYTAPVEEKLSLACRRGAPFGPLPVLEKAMLRRAVVALAGTVVLAGTLAAADKEVVGKFVKVDADAQTITLQTDAGKKEFALGADVKVLDARGTAVRDGLKDRRLAAGADVKLVLGGSTVKEVHLRPAAGDKGDPKDAKKEPPRDTKDAKKDSPRDAKDSPDAKELPGIKATVLKVDVDKGTATVQTEAGKKLELKLGEEVKYLGPRGGVSDKGIKDDRFVAGSEVRVVMDAGGKTVKEIHLPYRKSEAKEKEKEKEKEK
jgi:hypothetical protein